MTKQEILESALKAREEELLEYQINIDNYRLAIEKIEEKDYQGSMKAPMADFSERLKDLMLSAIIEREKARIIRDVIAAQLGVTCIF